MSGIKAPTITYESSTTGKATVDLKNEDLLKLMKQVEEYNAATDIEEMTEYFMQLAQYTGIDEVGIKKTFYKAVLSLKPSVVMPLIGMETEAKVKDFMTKAVPKYISLMTDLFLNIFLQRGNNLSKTMTKGNESIKNLMINFTVSIASSVIAVGTDGTKKFKSAAQLKSDDFTFARFAAVNPGRLVVIAARASKLGVLRELVKPTEMTKGADLPAHFRILSIATIIPDDWREAYLDFVSAATKVITPKANNATDEQHAEKVKELQTKSKQIIESLYKNSKSSIDREKFRDSAQSMYDRAASGKEEVKTT